MQYSNLRMSLGVLFRYFLILALLFFSLHLENPSLSHADRQISREYELKAGFIYNFTRFIYWPESVKRHINQRGFTFCITGNNPFGSILDKMQQKFRNKNKELLIKIHVPLSRLSQCHILFVDRSKEKYLTEILSSVKGFPVLVIGDTPGFAQKGVGINFVIEQNKIRFEINRNASKKAGLTVSSELLNLAIIVRERGM